MARVTAGGCAECDGPGVDTPDARCALLAGLRHGCISRDDALRCRLSPKAVQRRVATKRWRSPLPGVYVIAGSPDTWEQRLCAAILWVGEGAAVSGAAAAALWQLPGFAPGLVEISHAGTKKSRSGVIVRRVELPASDVTRLRIFPVTTPARTLADVAGRLRDEAFDAALHHCLHHRLASYESVAEVAGRRARRGCSGADRLRRAVAAYAPGDRPAASPLEVRVARRLRGSGLPRPQRQYEVTIGGRTRFLDFAWPAERVALEVDGYRWHSSRAAWERDRARLADLRRAGWKVVHVTRDELRDRFDAVMDELAQDLCPPGARMRPMMDKG